MKGRSSLRQLARVEPAGKSFPLQANCLYSGFYLNELMVRLLPEGICCTELFHQYHNSLAALENNNALELILRKFETSLLEELGIALDFSPIFDQHSDYFYYFSEQGFVPVLDKQPIPAFYQAHIQAIAQQNYDNVAAMQTYKNLMRYIISQLLGNKPLNSRKLFKRD